MPKREARILQLKYRYGQKTREIAAQYCVTPQQVSKMIHRGERMLRYPSRYRYLLVGCRAIAEREAQELRQVQILAKIKEELVRSFLQPNRFPGPLSGISDTHDRVDTILARCKLDTVQIHKHARYILLCLKRRLYVEYCSPSGRKSSIKRLLPSGKQHIILKRKTLMGGNFQ